MPRSQKIIVFLAVLIYFVSNPQQLIGQKTTLEDIHVSITQTPPTQTTFGHVIKIVNKSDSVFNGFVRLKASSDLRTLSKEIQSFTTLPSDSTFLIYKFFIAKNNDAGKKTISYDILNMLQEPLQSKQMTFDIEKREQINLVPNSAPILLTNAQDSVRVNIAINNSGNTDEDVILVFNVPNLDYRNTFAEIRGRVKAMEQKVFTFSFLASKNLLDADRFAVNVSAMKGPQKNIFGGTTIYIQNVKSDQQYLSLDPGSYFSHQNSENNSLSLLYRQFNFSSGMIQLNGAKDIDLPAGYLNVRGNLYTYNYNQAPIINNASLTYRLYANEFAIGNINESLELSLYGRGAKAKFSTSDRNKNLSVGIIDQNFNLISPDRWFDQYYSVFASGSLGDNNVKRGMKLSFIHQKNPYEQASYNIAGWQWRSVWGNFAFDLKAHAASTQRYVHNALKFTGAAELNYRGALFSDLNVNGSGYYSSRHFPGNRRGVFSFSQGANKKISNSLFLSASYNHNRSNPFYFTSQNNYETTNDNGYLSLSLPKFRNIYPTLYYQNQYESNNYMTDLTNDGLSLRSNRLGLQWRWNSPNAAYSILGVAEGGLFKGPLSNHSNFQSKLSLEYSYKWLTLRANYQDGAYYIYEYRMSVLKNKNFSRFMASLNLKKDFSDKLSLSANANFSNDLYQSNVPSVNLNAKYSFSPSYALTASGYWYSYQFMGTKNNIFNTEVGITYRFNKRQLSSGKKSTIIAQFYQDENSNGTYDENDIPVKNFMVDFSNRTLITDSCGKINYSRVPFGEYMLKGLSTGNWYFPMQLVKIDRYKTRLSIPLKQNGSLRGEIKYIRSKNSATVTPHYENVEFIISNADKSIIRKIATDSRGKFHVFIPNGDYTIALNKKTLPPNTDCEKPERLFRIEDGKIVSLETFTIETKSRKINMKNFTTQ